MIWARIKAAGANAWTAYHVWIIAVAAALLLIFGVLFKDWIGAKWREWDNRAFHSQIEKLEKEKAQLQAENNQLRGQIKQLFQQGDDSKLIIDDLTEQLKQFGKQGQEAVKAQERALEEYEKDKQAIGTDMSLFDRCTVLCTTRAEIRHPCPANWCDRYR